MANFFGFISFSGCKVDIGFILDSSHSLTSDYESSKQFLMSLAKEFNIGQDNNRGGVISFSYLATHSIKLSDHANSASFQAAVANIGLVATTTRIDLALRLAQREMFLPRNGGRPGVPKLLILLSDGQQTQRVNSENPADIADEIRAGGVKVSQSSIISRNPRSNHTHKHTHTHTHTLAHTHAHARARAHVCTYVRTYVRTYARTHARTHARTNARVYFYPCFR